MNSQSTVDRDSIAARDIFLRYNSVNGKSHSMQHRVWNADRFLEARQADCDALNNEERKKPESQRAKCFASVEVLTEIEFKAAKDR